MQCRTMIRLVYIIVFLPIMLFSKSSLITLLLIFLKFNFASYMSSMYLHVCYSQLDP